ncbi:MAG: hypothetical protein MI725_04995 [Pirellulales bacterium]|nr:hypothetical protein [Pirellulales bacterium]
MAALRLVAFFFVDFLAFFLVVFFFVDFLVALRLVDFLAFFLAAFFFVDFLVAFFFVDFLAAAFLFVFFFVAITFWLLSSDALYPITALLSGVRKEKEKLLSLEFYASDDRLYYAERHPKHQARIEPIT